MQRGGDRAGGRGKMEPSSLPSHLTTRFDPGTGSIWMDGRREVGASVVKPKEPGGSPQPTLHSPLSPPCGAHIAVGRGEGHRTVYINGSECQQRNAAGRKAGARVGYRNGGR